MIVLRRNAFLRKIIRSEQRFTPQQFQEEFNRTFGERVQVRHVQLATRAEVSRVRDQLDAGASFGELARKYSANQASAQEGGLLEPFSKDDDRLPELFRETAFALSPGEISEAVHIGEWYHLMLLEKIIPPRQRDFQEVRDQLEQRLRDRLTEPAMFELYERLFQTANIEIYDRVLREAFEKKHMSRDRSNSD